jgi:hypothetical protein
MLVALAAASVLQDSILLAAFALLAPRIGLMRHPRVSLLTSELAAFSAVALIAVLATAPVTQHVPGFGWSGVATAYFLAMAHRINGAPYPFFWSAPWEYQIGGLTWIVAFAGVLTVATSFPGRRYSPSIANALTVIGCLAVVAFAAAAAYVSIQTMHGVGG